MISRLKPLALAQLAVGGAVSGAAPVRCLLCCRSVRLLSTARPKAKPAPASSPEPIQRPKSHPPLAAPSAAAGRAAPFPLSDPAAGLTDQAQRQPLKHQWLTVDRDLASPGAYLALAKSRLTLLVVATAAAGYAMAPGPVDPLTLAACLAGTAAVSASANSVNQLLEMPYDAQMSRTRARPLVTGRVSPATAASFAAVSGIGGVALLASLASPVSAGIAAANHLLYCAAYTPAKRRTVANTAIGAVVGALPPLIGWSSATGGSLDVGALLLGLLMFHWQFPHFHALSWSLRDDYSRAGYCMASVLQPARCRRSAMANSIMFSAVCYCLPLSGVTSWFFLVDTLPFNLALLYFAAAFYWRGDSNSGRRLFKFTLVNLPIVFVLMLISRTPDSERERAKQDSARDSGQHHQFGFWRF
ncbi:hypothetical protein BOX15_Mlig033635g4 [Macrostomum lignano]|uniref:Uncharacterized protein n=3 Tax=Macrostomum lignano TaxID=282301 RepID=A0A267FSH3_9PLAT|nr:hypothetical protein BOX15_Mlig033635g4 [Macrostomum lignano]